MKKPSKYWQNKLDKWFRAEQKKGLISLRPFVMPRKDGKIPTVESICKEMYLALIQMQKDKKSGKICPDKSIIL